MSATGRLQESCTIGSVVFSKLA